VEPRRDLDRLFGLAARRGRELTAGRRFGRSPRSAPAVAARRRPAPSRAARQRLCLGTLADHPALRDHHDDRRELPRACRVRAVAVALFRAAARYGGLDSAIRQRLWPRRLGAARPISDFDSRLACHLSGAGRLHCRRRAAARRDISPCQPLPGLGRTRSILIGGSRGADDVGELDLGRSDAHAAFLAALCGLFVHRVGKFSGLAAPACLCSGSRLRQALCGGSARQRCFPRDRRDDRDRHLIRLYRARVVRDPRLRRLDSRGGLRVADHQPGPAFAVVAARLLFRPDLGARGARRSPPRPPTSFPAASSARSSA